MRSHLALLCLGLALLCATGQARASGAAPPDPGAACARDNLFAEQALSEYPTPVREPTWATRVGVASEASLAASARGGTRTLLLLGIAALVTIVGLGVTVRAARRAADLADVQSEFVSAVSHEMKTPLSAIKLASDTLASGRYSSPDAIGEYGQIGRAHV